MLGPRNELGANRAERREKWSNQFDCRAAFDLHSITAGHLSPLAEFDLTVNANTSLGDEGLGLTATQDAARQFEDLSQVDWTPAEIRGSASFHRSFRTRRGGRLEASNPVHVAVDRFRDRLLDLLPPLLDHAV